MKKLIFIFLSILILAQSLQASESIPSMDRASQQNLLSAATINNRLLPQTLPKQSGKIASGGIIFISFSLPDLMIAKLCDAAARYHLSVVVRGLVANRMPDTLTRIVQIKTLAEKEHLQFNGIAIDPLWFRAFNINHVPALVVTQRPSYCQEGHACPYQPFDVLYGTLTIKEALIKIAKYGTQKDVASRLLRNGDD